MNLKKMSQALFCLYSQKKQSWQSWIQTVQSGDKGGGGNRDKDRNRDTGWGVHKTPNEPFLKSAIEILCSSLFPIRRPGNS